MQADNIRLGGQEALAAASRPLAITNSKSLKVPPPAPRTSKRSCDPSSVIRSMRRSISAGTKCALFGIVTGVAITVIYSSYQLLPATELSDTWVPTSGAQIHLSRSAPVALPVDKLTRIARSRAELSQPLPVGPVPAQCTSGANIMWVPNPDGEQDTNSLFMPHIPREFLKHADPDLASIKCLLEEVAPSRQVVVAMATDNYHRPGGFVEKWVAGLKAAGMSNYVVIGMDDTITPRLQKDGINAWQFHQVRELAGKTAMKRVAGGKYTLVLTLNALGWDVLMTDMDVTFFSNVFDSMPKGVDVLSQTDGWNVTGGAGALRLEDDFSRGWASRLPPVYWHGQANFGHTFTRANVRTIELYHRMHEAFVKNPRAKD